jgi:outer membrane immunogenic protein
MKNRYLTSTILGAVAALGLVSGASAADLPRKSVPQQFVQPLPIFTWTGFYVGINGGYLFDTGNSNRSGFGGFGNSSSGDGYSIGGTIGYNYQIGNVVVGLEGDLAYVELNGRNSSTFGVGNGFNSNDMSYLGTFRGRLGYAIDRFLIYGTGGLAFADQNNNSNFGGFGRSSNNDIKFGYTIGGGVEYAFTNNWSVKAEYLCYDLGRSNNLTFIAGPGGGFFNNSSDNRGNIVRAGINYRF